MGNVGGKDYRSALINRQKCCWPENINIEINSGTNMAAFED